jgi:hypothetical protein
MSMPCSRSLAQASRAIPPVALGIERSPWGWSELIYTEIALKNAHVIPRLNCGFKTQNIGAQSQEYRLGVRYKARLPRGNI